MNKEEKKMKNDTLKYGLLGLVAGGAIVWLSTTTVVNSTNYGLMRMMGFQTKTESGFVQNLNSIDAHFIEQMIPHHEDAVTMAEIALTNAKRPEVKQLAENIIDSQSKEINQMKDWYKSWFGREVPIGDEVMGQHGMMGDNGMHMGMRGDESDITKLQQADDFDGAFIEHMIPHHQMAVMMASMLKDGTQRPEMKKLADDIITAQTNEIGQMREWLKEWSN